jgi:hypothetical protein
MEAQYGTVTWFLSGIMNVNAGRKSPVVHPLELGAFAIAIASLAILFDEGETLHGRHPPDQQGTHVGLNSRELIWESLP